MLELDLWSSSLALSLRGCVILVTVLNFSPFTREMARVKAHTSQGCRKESIHSCIEGLRGNFLAVQWLGLFTFTAVGLGSVPGWGAKIPQAAWHSQKRRKKT